MCKQFNNLNSSLKNKYIFPQDENSADLKISEQNPVSVKRNQPYLIHPQLSWRACRIPNESQGCAQQFLQFHIKPLHNVCANQVHQFATCTICIIYYTKYHIIQHRNHVLTVEQKKKDIQSNILEIFHETSICQLFLKIRYIPICVMCLLSAPCSSKQSQVQHVNFIMYVS